MISPAVKQQKPIAVLLLCFCVITVTRISAKARKLQQGIILVVHSLVSQNRRGSRFWSEASTLKKTWCSQNAFTSWFACFWTDTEVKPLKWLLDITVGYPENIDLNAQTIIAGTRDPCSVTVHYRRFPISELPSDTESLTKWMYERYIEKEVMLDIFHKTGKFPKWKEKERRIDERLLEESRPLNHCEYKVAALKLFYFALLYVTLGIFTGLPAVITMLITASCLYQVCYLIIYFVKSKMSIWRKGSIRVRTTYSACLWRIDCEISATCAMKLMWVPA